MESENKEEKVKKEKVIFVEGHDEVNFFDALLSRLELTEDYQVLQYRGKDNLNNYMSMISKTEEFTENALSIAIIRDTDKDLRSATDEVCYTIRNTFGVNNINSGLMKEGDGLRVGFYLMPGQGQLGELEDLVLSSLEGNEILNEVNSYIDSLRKLTKPEKEDSAFKFPKKPSKAKLHIYFSSMLDSDPRMGLSAKKRYVNFEHDSFASLISFIRSM